MKSNCKFRPFENLKDMLESKSFQLAHHPFKTSATTPAANCSGKYYTKRSGPEDEDSLFKKAMADVKPIMKKNCLDGQRKPCHSAGLTHTIGTSGKEALLRLHKLVSHGEGFIIADTPEYMEGTGYHVHQEMARRLHQGDFSIQAHIDLHGYTIKEAKEKFDQFIKTSIISWKRAVLIVHGRGLSSPGEPVLKTKVLEWLTSGKWRKWVIAFSSARSFDGGAGATYVLLRQRPYTRRFRKRAKTTQT